MDIDDQNADMLTEGLNNYDRTKTKDTLVALQYLNLNLGLKAPEGEPRSHQILVNLLAIRDLRDQWSTAPILSVLIGHALVPDVLRRIETLIPAEKRTSIAQIRCESLSSSSPQTLVYKLIHGFGSSKINALLGEIAGRWGFAPPNWSEYFNSTARRPRDQALLAFLDPSRSYMDISKYSDDRLFVLMAVKVRGAWLEKTDKSLQNDREIVLAAVRQDGRTLQHASQTLQNDREIVLAAVRQEGSALLSVSDALRNDREIVLAAVTQHGSVLQHASDSIKNDRQIVLAAVHSEGLALQYANESMKRNREIVLTAVRQNGWALEYACSDLQDDRDVVLAAVCCRGDALRCASWSLRNDREVVLTALAHGGQIESIPYSLRFDHEIMQAARR